MKPALIRAALAAVVTVALVASGATLASASTTQTDSATAPPTASLSGTVQDAHDARPVEGASIVVLAADGTQAGVAETGATGGYTVDALAPGAYRVSVSAAPSYQPVFWPDAASLEAAEVLDLASGDVRGGLDVRLQPVTSAFSVGELPETGAAGTSDGVGSAESGATVGASDGAGATGSAVRSESARSDVAGTAKADEASRGAIGGRVTRESDGSPVAGMRVWASSATAVAVTDTAADGTYLIRDVPVGADYRVSFVPGLDSGLAREYWQGTSDYFAAALIRVDAGATVSGIDARLRASGTVRGTVTRVDTGAPVAGAQVFVGSEGSTTTGADGTYAVEGVTPGDHRIGFYGPAGSGLSNEYWNDAQDWQDADVVTVAPGATVTGIDAALERYGSVSGELRGTDRGAIITLWDLQGRSSRSLSVENGSYSLSGVAAGDYYASADPVTSEGDYAVRQYYPDAQMRSAATLIRVEPGAEITGIDFTPSVRGGVDIAGTVSAPSVPASGFAVVTAYRWGGAAWDEARRITAWGDYSFRGDRITGSSALPAGTYTVGFEAEGYCPQFWNARPSLDAADRITPMPSSTRTGIDAALSVDCSAAEITPGTPTITGAAVVGATLTADPGVWAPDPIELSYQWLADGAPIEGATSRTLALTDARHGALITVAVTGSRPGYTSVTASSAPVGPVARENLPPAGAGAVAGQLALWVDASEGADGWVVAVHGGDGAGMTPIVDDLPLVVGRQTVAVPQPGLYQVAIRSTATGTSVGLGDHLVVGAPTISGLPVVGRELSASVGELNASTVALAYQWSLDGVPGDGATSAVFVPGADAVGRTLTVTATLSMTGLTSASATSAPTAAVALGALTVSTPRITGEPGVGQEVTVDASDWGPSPIELTYQWVLDGDPVTDATAPTFVPVADQVGRELSVSVTGMRPGFATESRRVVVGTIPASVAVSEPRAQRGQSLTVKGEHFGPEEEVELVLHSSPLPLGTTRTDAQGRFSAVVTIPAEAETGAHRIVATGLSSGVAGSAAIEVYGPSPEPSDPGAASTGTPDAGTAGTRLPSSGGTVPIAAIVLGLGLLIGGGLLARRRRAAAR